MNVDRAKEILQSPNTIDVTYQGKSVWITDIDSKKATAHVRMPMTTDNIIEVLVDELSELK